MHPSYLIGKQVKRFLHKKFYTNYCNAVTEFKTTLYYKLPYISLFFNNTKKKIKELCKKFSKTSNANIVFSPFKVSDFFSSKVCLPSDLKPFVVTSLFVQGVNPVISMKLNAIYLPGLMSTW